MGVRSPERRLEGDGRMGLCCASAAVRDAERWAGRAGRFPHGTPVRLHLMRIIRSACCYDALGRRHNSEALSCSGALEQVPEG